MALVGAAKKGKKSTEKSSHLSAEFIVDSESDGDPYNISIQAKNDSKSKGLNGTPQKKAAKKTSSKSDNARGNDPTPQKKSDAIREGRDKPTPGKAADHLPGEEEMSTSQKKQKSTSQETANGITSKTNGTLKKQQKRESAHEDLKGSQDESTEDDEGSSVADSLATSAKLPSETKSTTEPTNSQVDIGKDVESASSRSSDSSESSDGEDQADEPSSITSKAQDVPSGINSRPDPPPKKYVPPKGFSRSQFTIEPPLLSIFSQDNLRGKQLWHITAPASVPMSMIKEVAVKNLEESAAVLSHDGVGYGFSDSKPERSEASILVPESKESKYVSASQSVSKVLNLHQVIKPVDLGHRNGSSQDGLLAGTYAKPKPEQPTGLKMRYRPFGDQDSNEEENDIVADPPSFRTPPEMPAPRKKEKRKADSDPVVDRATQRSPGKKKRKKDKSDIISSQTTQSHSTNIASSQPLAVSNGDSSQSRTRGADASASAPAPGTVPTNDSKRRKDRETPEEKAARRAARAECKEKKKKKKRKHE